MWVQSYSTGTCVGLLGPMNVGPVLQYQYMCGVVRSPECGSSPTVPVHVWGC